MKPVATSEGDRGLEDLLRSTPRFARAAGALAVYEAGRRLWAQGRSWYSQYLVYSVRVADSDPLYESVLDWLVAELAAEGGGNKRKLAVNSRGAGASLDSDDGMAQPAFDSEPPRPTKLRVTHADDQNLRLIVGGHPVSVELSADDTGSDRSERRRGVQTKYVTFRARSAAGQRAVLRHLESIHRARQKRDPVLRIANSWGHWETRSDLPPRTMESVVLPTGQKQALITDLRDFLDAESRYNELAIPWHRGYLFHGPPGTGKTSLAKALAHEFGLDLWYVSISDLRESGDLVNLVNNVQPRSLLLLEDVDVAIGTHTRREGGYSGASGTDGGPVTPAALYNALDGVSTPHGLITVMTTNHVEWLDPALTRAGRMDRVEEIGLPGPEEIAALFARFYGRWLTDRGATGIRLGRHSETDIGVAGLSQADVSELFKRHLDDPGGAQAALIAEIESRVAAVSSEA